MGKKSHSTERPQGRGLVLVTISGPPTGSFYNDVSLGAAQCVGFSFGTSQPMTRRTKGPSGKETLPALCLNLWPPNSAHSRSAALSRQSSGLDWEVRRSRCCRVNFHGAHVPTTSPAFTSSVRASSRCVLRRAVLFPVTWRSENL